MPILRLARKVPLSLAFGASRAFPINFGTSANPWQYTTHGELYAVPGYIGFISYEADGQTRRILYANGVENYGDSLLNP